jgi:hypothetical protein
MFCIVNAVIPGPLEQMVERETFGEILEQMTPEELTVAALRLEGLTDAQIAALLGEDAATVSRRMVRAQARIATQLPETSHLLGRRYLGRNWRRRRDHPLEYGLLCDWRAPDDRRRRHWRQRQPSPE